MPAVICKTCGGFTNTAFLNNFDNSCYIRINKETINWERGCSNDFRDHLVNMIGEPLEKNGIPVTTEELNFFYKGK